MNILTPPCLQTLQNALLPDVLQIPKALTPVTHFESSVLYFNKQTFAYLVVAKLN